MKKIEKLVGPIGAKLDNGDFAILPKGHHLKPGDSLPKEVETFPPLPEDPSPGPWNDWAKSTPGPL